MLRPNVLRKKKDFSRLYNKGKSVGGKYVILFYRKNNLPYSRTAFLASKKVGMSVARNRARRLMKESYRELAQQVSSGYDLLFIARNSINGLKCADVKKSIEAAFKKSGLLTQQNQKKEGEAI